MKNTGISYEKLVQQIFSDFLNQEDVENVKVEHNVRLEGKTGTHQIDVYWKFKVGGIVYETIVQAKDWKSHVDQGEILKFKAILDDLPGQPRGVFITSTGYQSGAREIADNNGIILYELRKSNEQDWEGKIKAIDLKIIAVGSHINEVKFTFDNDWVKTHKQKLGINESVSIVISTTIDKMELLDEHEVVIEMVSDLLSRLIAVNQGSEIMHTFDTGTFVRTSHKDFPIIKLNSIYCSVSRTMVENKRFINFEEMVKYILKNILDETEKVISKEYE